MADIKSTIVNLTSSFAKTSGELVKTAKLNIELANQEENLKSIYMDIGKKVHEIYMFGGSLGKVFDEKYKEIITAEAKIKEMNDRIGVIRGVKTCGKCGKSVDRKAEFCPFCGNRMFTASPMETGIKPPDAPASYDCPSPVNHSPEAADTMADSANSDVNEVHKEYKTCPSCSSKNESNARFCLSCGRVL